MSIEAADKDLNEMILQGKIMEAFEKHYADDVVMAENFDTECVGKDANRARELEFLGKVGEFHGAAMTRAAVTGDTSFSEWTMDVTFKGGPRVNMRQVTVRQWKNGKIVHERFYYKG